MKVFRSPRARRSPDARAAPTLRRDLRHAPLKRPCSRPGSYQRSSGVPVPGDNTPRIIDDRAGKSYRNRRPGPDHRGLPNMVMGSGSVTNALTNIFLARAGTSNYPQNAVLWFLPCLFVTEMLFLGTFTLVKSKRAIRHDWAVAATLATVSFLSIMVMHSFGLPIDRLRLPWALDILPFSMLFYCIGCLLSRFLMPCMQKSEPKASLHIVYAVIGMAGLDLLWIFDELTGLSVNLNGASTSNPFWMLCAALLGFISSLMLCVAIDCRLLQFLGRASLTIMCVHEPVKRVLCSVMAKILGMNTDALRVNLAYAMLVTVVTVAICVAVHLIMDRFVPVLIGSSRHNPVLQDKTTA